MQKYKKPIIIICLVFLVIILLLLTCLFMNINKQEKQEQDEIAEWVDETIDYNNVKKEKVSGAMQFYTVKNCLNYYFDMSNINSSNYYGVDETGNNVKIVNENQIKHNIHGLLSDKYIKDNNITIDNLYSFVDKYEERVIFVPIDMYVLQGEHANKYLVYGFVLDTSYTKKKDIYIYVNLDEINNTFSVEPVNKQYNSIDEIGIDNENEEISENDYNYYDNPAVTESYITQEYYDTYKQIMLGDSKLAYNYLNEEYRNKRFGSYEEFDKYINENREYLLSTGITKYLVNQDGENTEYVCLDSKENYYIFIEKGLNNYTVMLDAYTIEREKFTTEYNKGSISTKVQMNIDKFIQMINAKDYKNSYNLLYDQFKNNYFQTEDIYKQYIQSNFFEYNKVTYDKFSNEGETYIYELTLSDKTENSSDTKKLTVIMKLEEGTNFVMSFNIE